MGGPPMGGPPMGGMPPRPISAGGMSRVVPVVVSAGLAVGVFCGLLFGLGTGKRHAVADTTKASNGVKRAEEPTVDPDSINTPRPKPPVTAPPTVPSAGSGSAVAAAARVEPTVKSTKIVVEIKPEAAAQTAKVYIDGKEITGTVADIPLTAGTTKQKVKVAVKAPGFKDIEQEVEAEGEGESTTLKFELAKGRSVPTTAASSDSSAPAGAGHPSGGTTGGGTTGGGTTGGGNASGGNPDGGNTGSKPAGGSKPPVKKPGKGSALIDI